MKICFIGIRPVFTCFFIVGSLNANTIFPDLGNCEKLRQFKNEQKSLMVDNWLTYQYANYGPLCVADNNLFDFLDSKSSVSKQKSNKASPEFLQRVKKVADAHNIEFENDILHIPFKDYVLPLIAEEKYGDDTLSLEGILKDPREFPGEEEPCLSLILGEESIEISFLATTYKACPIPQKGGGSFLLEFTEEVARLFSRDALELADMSQVRCSKTKEWIDFRVLNFLKSGKSWYQNYGYEPESGSFEHEQLLQGLSYLTVEKVKEHFSYFNQNNLESLKEELLSRKDILPTPIKDFFALATFSELQNFLALVDELELKYRKIESIANEDDIFLGEWLSWIWNHHCKAYVKLVRFIFPNAKQVQGIGFNYLIPGGINYIKYLH